MFKKSRRKIVAAIMSILVLLWVGTLGVIYASSYFEMKHQNEQMLEAHAQMYSLPNSFGDIALDTSTLILSCRTNGQSVRLSEKEYRILEYLIANSGQILTREQLAVKIWGFESDAEYNNVEVYMSFTRKKLAFVEAKTEIKAVRGIGYELRCDDV